VLLLRGKCVAKCHCLDLITPKYIAALLLESRLPCSLGCSDFSTAGTLLWAENRKAALPAGKA
jgi:hypothetical protein